VTTRTDPEALAHAAGAPRGIPRRGVMDDPVVLAMLLRTDTAFRSATFQAFLRQYRAHCWRECEAAINRAEAEAWEPVRRRLAELRGQPTWAEQQELRRLPDPHTLQATPGWPPIQIPGQPGKYLTYDQNRQTAA